MKKHKTEHISKLKIEKFSSINLRDFETYHSLLDFSNPKKVRKQLTEHFLAGEHETFFEILSLYLDHEGKSKISKETKIPERTIYNFIKGDHKTSSENVFKIMKYISCQASEL